MNATCYCLDTEFLELGPEHPVRLISIAVICEDRREYYAELPGALRLASSSDWMRQHVLPHLNQRGLLTKTHARIAADLEDFMNPDMHGSPQVWGNFADYDWVVFCQLWKRMVDMPPWMPRWCRELKQETNRLGIRRDEMPPKENRHHALDDARWNMKLWQLLQDRVMTPA